jgi:hypothetical protein
MESGAVDGVERVNATARGASAVEQLAAGVNDGRTGVSAKWAGVNAEWMGVNADSAGVNAEWAGMDDGLAGLPLARRSSGSVKATGDGARNPVAAAAAVSPRSAPFEIVVETPRLDDSTHRCHGHGGGRGS